MSQRMLLAALLALLGLLQYQLWVTPKGVREVLRLRGEVTAQREDNHALARRNARLDAEVADLRGDGMAAIEERARTDLGMIRDHETFFRESHRTLRGGGAQEVNATATGMGSTRRRGADAGAPPAP